MNETDTEETPLCVTSSSLKFFEDYLHKFLLCIPMHISLLWFSSIEQKKMYKNRWVSLRERETKQQKGWTISFIFCCLCKIIVYFHHQLLRAFISFSLFTLIISPLLNPYATKGFVACSFALASNLLRKKNQVSRKKGRLVCSITHNDNRFSINTWWHTYVAKKSFLYERYQLEIIILRKYWDGKKSFAANRSDQHWLKSVF